MKRRIGGIDLRCGLGVLHNCVGGQALANLHLNICFIELRDFGGGIAGHAKNVRVIEFDFGAPVFSRTYAITHRDRSIHDRGNPIAVVAALRRHAALNQAHARHSRSVWVGIRGHGGLTIGLIVGRWRWRT